MNQNKTDNLETLCKAARELKIALDAFDKLAEIEVEPLPSSETLHEHDRRILSAQAAVVDAVNVLGAGEGTGAVFIAANQLRAAIDVYDDAVQRGGEDYTRLRGFVIDAQYAVAVAIEIHDAIEAEQQD